MRADLDLDMHKLFNIRVYTWHLDEAGDEQPNKIGDWIIKGAVVISRQDQTLDIPLTAVIDGDGTEGLFDLNMGVADRDLIFDTFEKKNALDYEVRANFFNGQGMILAKGNLILLRSRQTSS